MNVESVARVIRNFSRQKGLKIDEQEDTDS
jgi:hypothetical protein